MIVTYTGKYFDFNNMDKNKIDIDDIAHALARINRFIGHSVRAFSVAEHTIIGYVMAKKMGYTPLQQLHWLVHDFTEAYVGDCPSPLKAILPEYQRIEKEVSRIIYEHIGIAYPTAEEKALVDRIDRTMLMVEMRDLTLHNHVKLLNDDVYVELLMVSEFLLPKEEVNTELLTNTLRNVYFHLLEEVNG